jgi:hypothetical protein
MVRLFRLIIRQNEGRNALEGMMRIHAIKVMSAL